jgi:prolyl oligopeptidase
MRKILRSTLWGVALAMQFVSVSAQTSDPLQWLEDPHGERALQWAREATSQTRARLSTLPSYAAILEELKTTLAQAPAEANQLPLGERMVRFHRDAAHPHGLLQSAPRDAKGAAGTWKTLLDIAVLREREGIPFELQAYPLGSSCLAPEYRRCLLRLSPGGGDEVEIREFDLVKGDFVPGGFRVGKSRAFAEWMSADQLLVGHTVGDSPKTLAGWPAAYRLWERGQLLAAAPIVFQAEPTDAVIALSTVGSGAQRQGVINRVINFSTFEVSLVDSQGRRRAVELPQSLKAMGVLATTSRHLIAQLAKDATIAGKPYRAETVVAYDVSANVSEANRVSTVYAPAEGEFLDSVFDGLAADGDDVYPIVSHKLRQRVVVARADARGRWLVKDVMTVAPGDSVSLRADARDGRGVVAAIDGFVTPRSQYLLRSNGERQLLAQDPSLIDAKGFVTEIGSAVSKDGTSVDYFLLRARQQDSNPVPLLMTGYGAFAISFRPGYFNAVVGGPALKVWLERGGALAIPAIRGGGERGSAWHEAAMREKRQNSYDDFIAVTEHLIKTGVTAKGGVGIFGQSNGGLLTATLVTQRPDLFGAVVSDVPLTDLMRMRHMGMGSAWINEYGNPDTPAEAKAMLAYSPYQNVRKENKYPPVFITISTEDNRVGPGHARKFAHRLIDAGATTYFYEDEEGGHSVSDALRNPELMALRMSFLIDTLMRPATIAASIDRAAEAVVAGGASVGLQVAVFKNGVPVLVKGYGQADLEQLTPVTNDSVFRIGSVTKQFTAAAILKLQEEGRLSVDDKLAKYFPEFPGAGRITLKHMLQHTAGVHDFTDDEDTYPTVKLARHSTAELIAYFAAMPKVSDFEPGTSWSYSNTAYCMLSAIVEKVEGMPMAAVLKRRFFVPLGMTQTALDDESEIVRGRVHGYAGDGPSKFQNPEFISMSIPVGAGAMRSTATDLVKWNAALFGGKVLKAASFAAMTAPGTLASGEKTSQIIRKVWGTDVEYGFALGTSSIEGHRKVGHNGGIEGFSASLSEFPQDRITVVVLSNTTGNGVGVGQVAKRIERIALGL